MANQNPNPKLAFVAYDLGPSNLLDKVAAEFPSSTRFFGSGGRTPMPSKDEIVRAVYAADGVVVGISSALDKIDYEAWTACCAFDNGKPVAIIADTFGTLSKRFADQVTGYAHLGLVVSPAEVAGAQELMPHATLDRESVG